MYFSVHVHASLFFLIYFTDGDGTTDQTQTQSQPQTSSHTETVEMDIGEEDQINECEMDIEESTTEESVKGTCIIMYYMYVHVCVLG